MTIDQLSPRVTFVDIETGKLTAEGIEYLQLLQQGVNDSSTTTDNDDSVVLGLRPDVGIPRREGEALPDLNSALQSQVEALRRENDDLRSVILAQGVYIGDIYKKLSELEKVAWL